MPKVERRHRRKTVKLSPEQYAEIHQRAIEEDKTFQSIADEQWDELQEYREQFQEEVKKLREEKEKWEQIKQEWVERMERPSGWTPLPKYELKKWMSWLKEGEEESE